MKHKYKHFNPEEHNINVKIAKVRTSSHDKSETDEDKLLSQRKSNQFMSDLLNNLRDNPRYKYKDDGGEFFSSQP